VWREVQHIMKENPIRKSVRLKGHDYSQAGCYFITVCVKDKHALLGRVVGAISNRPSPIARRPQTNTDTEKVELSEYGHIVEGVINEIPTHYPYVYIDKYIIMPNHMHILLGIRYSEVNLDGNLERYWEGDGRLLIAPTTLSNIVRQFKSRVSKIIGFSMWQKSYHDHIVRTRSEYQRIWKYIDENPSNWIGDEYYQQ